MRFFKTAARRVLSARRLGVPLLAAGMYSAQCSTCDAPAASEELPTLVRQAEEERKKKEQLKNPGVFERLTDEGRRIVNVDSIDGFRLEVTKMVTPHFYLNHTFMLGTNIPHIPANAMYDFSTQIVLPGNQLVVAHLAPGGGVDGRYHVGIGENAVAKFTANLQPNAQKDSFGFEGELNGADYTLTMKAQGTTEVHASYTQSITPSLAIGGDSTYDFQHGMGVMSVGGKYSGADWSAAGLVMSMGAMVNLQYVRHVSPNRMTLVADLMLQPFQGQSRATLGAEVNMKQSKFTTTLDSDFRLASMLEARVIPNALNLLLTAEMLQSKNHYKFGYGFQLQL